MNKRDLPTIEKPKLAKNRVLIPNKEIPKIPEPMKGRVFIEGLLVHQELNEEEQKIYKKTGYYKGKYSEIILLSGIPIAFIVLCILCLLIT